MVGHFLPRLRFRPVYVSGTAKLRQALFTAMNDWHTAREFAVEAAKREIMRCDDVEKLRYLCFNLMLQTEALKEMVGDMLLNG
jgi:hypothetical protein